MLVNGFGIEASGISDVDDVVEGTVDPVPEIAEGDHGLKIPSWDDGDFLTVEEVDVDGLLDENILVLCLC